MNFGKEKEHFLFPPPNERVKKMSLIIPIFNEEKILVQLISWWDLPVKQNNNDSSIYDKQIDFLSRTPVTQYTQVFHEKLPFVSNLSVLDLLFCEGPMGRKWFVDYSK